MSQFAEKNGPSLWLELMGLIIISFLMAGAHARFFPMMSRLAPPRPNPEADRNLNEVIPISMDQAQTLRKSGAVFLDIRPKEEYQAERIPGALLADSVRPSDLKGKAVVIYGHPGDLDAGAELGRRLMRAGVKPVYVLVDGEEGWAGAGFKVETWGKP